jgi:DNA glycosylase AlkZ-like
VSGTVLTRRALNRAALARQLLLVRTRLKPVTAVERLGPMQAQLARPPFVGLWSRLEGFEREDLVRAIERREVVRGTLLRGTIHLTSRRDFLAFRPVLAPMLAEGASTIIGDRLTGVDLDAVTGVARAHFTEAPRTFDQLRKHLARAFPKADVRATAYYVRMHLPLVQVPAPGATWSYPAQADFALAESWLGSGFSATARPEALALRYFAAFGPASAADFQAWSGVRAAPIVGALRKKLKMFRDEDGRELFDLPTSPRPPEDEEAPVRFLPPFDSLLLAYADRSRIVPPAFKPALASRNLLVPAAFLVSGLLAGRWDVKRTGRQARLEVTPFRRLTGAERGAVAAEAEALVRFAEPGATRWAVAFAKG